MPLVKARAVYDFNAQEVERLLLAEVNRIRQRDGEGAIDDWPNRNVDSTAHRGGGVVVIFDAPGSDLVPCVLKAAL